MCDQETQWSTGSDPADEDDGWHAGKGRSGSAERRADWDVPSKFGPSENL